MTVFAGVSLQYDSKKHIEKEKRKIVECCVCSNICDEIVHYLLIEMGVMHRY